MLRIGVVGCGDVSHRRYFPTLAAIPDRVTLVGFCSSRETDAAAAVERWAPADGHPYSDLETMLREARLDGVYNLTPAPVHAPITRACLEAGAHVYSEKPLAGSVAEATDLIELARTRRLQLLCAPGSAVLSRIRWMREITHSGQFGPVSLVTAHTANMGPAGWRAYTGDPSVFYGPSVGPMFDHGIYRLHEVTAILGPIRRVQAMGRVALPTRLVRAGKVAGQTIEVTAPDTVVVNLEFASGVLGTLVATFAAPSTQVPWLELHFRDATFSFAGDPYDPDTRADVFHDDDSPRATEHWERDVPPPPPADRLSTIEAGAIHFVDVLEGRVEPVLTAEHARHVLDVIVQSYASIADGQAHLTETTF